jgi:hypothetical protein
MLVCGEHDLRLRARGRQVTGGDKATTTVPPGPTSTAIEQPPESPPSRTRASSARLRPAFSIIRTKEIPSPSTMIRSTSRICSTDSHGSASVPTSGSDTRAYSCAAAS